MTDPNAPRYFRLRSRFIEQGRLAWLSHLEVAHALERAVRRAQLPFAVTQGFSPHMKIAFGAALPVGVGSTCEVFDVQLTRYVSPERALKALQAASVQDLMIRECSYIEGKAPAASVAFPFSTYEAKFDGSVACIEVPEIISVTRKRKKKELVVSDYLLGPMTCEGERVRFTLEAKPSGSLRPDVLLAHCEVPASLITLTRIRQEVEPGGRS